VTTSGTTAEFAQAFTGGFAINKAGAGTLVLSGTNTNTPSGTNPAYTNAGGGILFFTKPAALAGIMQVATGATATYRIQSDSDMTTSASGIQSFGTGTFNLQVDRQTAGSATGLDYNFTNGNDGGNDISGGATVNISAGANITSGTPTVTITKMRSQGGNSSGTATINASGVNVTVGSLTATNNGADFWALGGTSTGNVVTGAISHAVTKNGAGTWTLSSTSNAYTGATQINAGTLRVNGSTSSSSAFTVASGATLAGTGNVRGTVAVSGNIAPGNGTVAIGTLNAGATTWNGGSNLFQFDLAATGSTSDRLAVTGALTKGTGSTFQFDFLSSTPVSGTTFTLATFGSHAGGFAVENFSYTGLTGPNYSSSYFTLNPTSLQFTAVPEASNLIIGGLLGLGMMSRRRKNA
jgi:autotransporter-associated beta strand protein